MAKPLLRSIASGQIGYVGGASAEQNHTFLNFEKARCDGEATPTEYRIQ